MTTTFAFIGFGEAAQYLSKGLQDEGAVVSAAYDILFDAPDGGGAKGDAVRAALSERGIPAAATPGDVAAVADMVISAVTAKQVAAAGDATGPYMKPGQIFLDINSASPGAKRDASRSVVAAGADYVEAAVMSNVPPHGHRVPMFLAGAAADKAAALMTPLGMDVEVVGTEIGQASSIKMIRSVMVKGLEALLVESLTAAHRAGVEDKVIESLGESFPGLDWRGKAGYHLGRVALHAARRADEMEEVAETLRDIGVPPTMAEATAKQLHMCANMGLREMFADDLPDEITPFVAAISTAHSS
jgi:3-hydroxyisobutyrate dehydrogenase-like beta-hydroxyacid dehydrogenase